MIQFYFLTYIYTIENLPAQLTLLLSTHFRIVARSSESNYISVYKGSGCWSYVGRQGGRQYLSLGTGCASSVGVVIHEFMHAIGSIQIILLVNNKTSVNMCA